MCVKKLIRENYAKCRWLLSKSFQNDDEETQQDNTVTDRENEDESVEELIERAENMIRENAQQCNQVSIPETSVAINEWMQPFNASQGSFEDSPIESGQSTIPAPNHTAASRMLRFFFYNKIENNFTISKVCHCLSEMKCPMLFRLIQTVTMK